MEAPKHLGHKPLVSVDDYESMDGHFASHTDAKALSIGHAQYDYNDISMKVWRKPKRRWSPQSEELPIHRNLDLTILFLDVLLGESTNSVSPEWGITGEESAKQALRKYYKDKEKFLKPRLKEIKELLNKIEL